MKAIGEIVCFVCVVSLFIVLSYCFVCVCVVSLFIVLSFHVQKYRLKY